MKEEARVELFRENGHLTDEGLCAVVDGTLDELGRLEACEHLSFCDSCLERYSGLLTDDVLLTPETPVAPAVHERIRRKSLRLLVNRYARVAAVAVMALALWGTGVFSSLVPTGAQRWSRAPQLPQPVEASVSAASRVNGFFRSAGDSISAAFDSLRRPQADAAPQGSPAA